MATEKTSRPIRKIAAIISLFAVLVLIAWLSVSFVRTIPNSFASLATLAQSVLSFDSTQTASVANNGPDEKPIIVRGEFVVTSDTNVIDSDDTVHLSWSEASESGSYVFSYDCIEGVSMTIIEDAGVRNINCGVNYNIGDTNKLAVNIESEKERFADVPYTLSFLKEDAIEPTASDEAMITIVNESVPLVFADSTSAETSDVSDTETSSNGLVAGVSDSNEVVVPEPAPEPIVEEVSTSLESTTEPTPVVESAQTPTTVIEENIPEQSDLVTRFVATGFIVNGAFANNGGASAPRAIQFEVINSGGLTSGTWNYTATFAGRTVNSDNQDPLEPAERATITIGFPSSNNATVDLAVTVETSGDLTTLNNQFTQTVTLN